MNEGNASVPGQRFPQSGETGTSLLELLLAMVAGLIVIGSMMQALVFFQRQFSHQQSMSAQQQDLRLALEVLEQELHMAEPTGFSITHTNEVEFSANIHGLRTTVATPVSVGQTTISVVDGRGWAERKPILACWQDQCQAMTLAQNGQMNLLIVTQPVLKPIPAGAWVSVVNRIRYYTKRDDNGVPRLLRQIDGGASVLVGDIQDVRFSYWNEKGQMAAQSGSIRRVVVSVTLPRGAFETVREIALRL
ncbi:hypothetical protein W02_21190 [Nitrospira sp. KM1]|uniref:PilW family protein n=1 Tax=Nitrospira sp. KM1 TaxID=1936990 RepID=UPI0013A7378D|nr:hypothetical protein [Nitrospira sp. KM1]BCA54979.1 hypothetical protein W02_21190 [Nitrospira sp. KM1]